MLTDLMSQPSVLDRKGFIKADPGSELSNGGPRPGPRVEAHGSEFPSLAPSEPQALPAGQSGFGWLGKIVENHVLHLAGITNVL